ncbi:MAG: hypothetical protein IH571_03345, partial [Acholeplasmataceae bacterium]|nr:hypothetical protein [Acholeplasmataceae bacterium]
VLTHYEVFIFQFANMFMFGWTLLLVLLMIKEIHGYKIGALIKNVLLTLFTMVMIMLIAFVVYLLINQVYDYVFGVIKEVISRVGN